MLINPLVAGEALQKEQTCKKSKSGD